MYPLLFRPSVSAGRGPSRPRYETGRRLSTARTDCRRRLTPAVECRCRLLTVSTLRFVLAIGSYSSL